jgi:hypothetical protein
MWSYLAGNIFLAISMGLVFQLSPFSNAPSAREIVISWRVCAAEHGNLSLDLLHEEMSTLAVNKTVMIRLQLLEKL